MLKDKEVISERAKQDAIVRRVHKEAHAGINKTTATIAEQYHWNGIRSSVTVAIKDCPICQSRAGESSNGSHEKEQARQNAIELLGSETQHANPEPPSGYEAARDGRTQYDPSMTLDPRLTYNDNAG